MTTGPEFQEGRGAGWASIPASARPRPPGPGTGSSRVLPCSHRTSCRHQAPRGRSIALAAAPLVFCPSRSGLSNLGGCGKPGPCQLACVFPCHQGQWGAAYLVWRLLSKSWAFSPQIHFKKKGGGRGMGKK